MRGSCSLYTASASRASLSWARRVISAFSWPCSLNSCALEVLSKGAMRCHAVFGLSCDSHRAVSVLMRHLQVGRVWLRMAQHQLPDECMGYHHP